MLQIRTFKELENLVKAKILKEWKIIELSFLWDLQEEYTLSFRYIQIAKEEYRYVSTISPRDISKQATAYISFTEKTFWIVLEKIKKEMVDKYKFKERNYEFPGVQLELDFPGRQLTLEDIKVKTQDYAWGEIKRLVIKNVKPLLLEDRKDFVTHEVVRFNRELLEKEKFWMESTEDFKAIGSFFEGYDTAIVDSGWDDTVTLVIPTLSKKGHFQLTGDWADWVQIKTKFLLKNSEEEKYQRINIKKSILLDYLDGVYFLALWKPKDEKLKEALAKFYSSILNIEEWIATYHRNDIKKATIETFLLWKKDSLK